MAAVTPAQMVEAACRDLLGAAPAAARPLAGTANTAVHRVTLPGQPAPLVVKVWAGRAHWKAHKERLALEAVAGAAGFRVPRVVAGGAVPGRDAAALILEDLGPRSLGQAARIGTCTRGEALTMLGRLLAGFHRQPPPPPGPLLHTAGLPAQADDLRRHLPPGVQDAARRALDRVIELTQDAREVWCHGDLHPENVLLPGTVPYLVDFELSAFAAAEYDVAQTLVTSDALTPGERGAVVAAYGAGLDDALLTHLVAFHALRGRRWAALHEGRDAGLWESRMYLALADYPS